MNRLFWGLFHWVRHSETLYRDGVYLEVVCWYRLWDEKEGRAAFDEACSKLREAGWDRFRLLRW